MKRGVTTLAATLLAGAVLLPGAVRAADDDLQKRIDALAKEVQALKQQTATQEKAQGKSLSNWLTVGGDYRFRVDSLRGKTADYYGFQEVFPWMLGGMTGPMPQVHEADTVKNNVLYTNRVGLNIKAKVTQNVSFTTRLLMYKAFGNSSSEATDGAYFADRVGVFDG
ncbi:MAG: DUF3373 family protein, partial [Deltaproteobacteria bacterium]|nr:DUF3373 family protein [Deltaproteobacteria bacterium]